MRHLSNIAYFVITFFFGWLYVAFETLPNYQDIKEVCFDGTIFIVTLFYLYRNRSWWIVGSTIVLWMNFTKDLIVFFQSTGGGIIIVTGTILGALMLLVLKLNSFKRLFTKFLRI